jgi:hypothetical protein
VLVSNESIFLIGCEEALTEGSFLMVCREDMVNFDNKRAFLWDVNGVLVNTGECH